MRRRHQQRAFGIIEQLTGAGSVQNEVSVPLASRQIDGLVVVEEPSDGWGPLRHLVGHRLLVVEHYSGAPSLPAVTGACAKHALIVEAWWTPRSDRPDVDRPWIRAGRATDPPRPPLLLILSAGRPRTALAELPQLAAADNPAIFRARNHALGDIVLVHLRGLRQTRPRGSVLQMIATPRTASEASAGLEAVHRDPDLLHSTRIRLMEAIVNGTIPTTDDEQLTAAERLRREGRQEGRQEGKDVLLRFARRRLGHEAAASLAEIADLEQLEEELNRLLDEARQPPG